MSMLTTTKAGNSAGAKKGWKSRVRGGAMKVGAILGSVHPGLPTKIKNKMRKEAGMKPLTPRKKATRPAHVSKADWKKMDKDDREFADLAVDLKEASMNTTKAMLGQGKSLSEMVDDVRRALSSQLPKAPGKDWSDCYIREIYADKVIIDCPSGSKLADYEPDADKGFCLTPESDWQDVVQVWMPAQKEFQWSFTEKAGTSQGAKLGWQHRLAGRLGKVVGAWHGGAAGAGIGTAIAGPLGGVLGFAGGARVGMKIGARVGTRVSLGISKIKTGNKKIIAAGAKMLARGFKKSAEQKYGSTYRAIKGGAGKLAAMMKSGGTVNLGGGRTATFGNKEALMITLKGGPGSGRKGHRTPQGLMSAAGRAKTARIGRQGGYLGIAAKKLGRGIQRSLAGGSQKKVFNQLRKEGFDRKTARIGSQGGKLGMAARNLGDRAQKYLAGKSADSFSVKQIGDDLRWFSVSSTAFQDKDRQIVTTAALERDVELSESMKEAQGDYGPLRFWHVGIPGGPGLDLGRCDFRLMIGRSLIESGTFVTKEIGLRAQELADELGLSIGFRHPSSEPGPDGLFHNTLTLERSLLPSSKESNLLTTFAVS